MAQTLGFLVAHGLRCLSPLAHTSKGMFTVKHLALALMAGASALALMPPPAHAILQIAALVNGTSSFSCFDNQSGCDQNNAIGTLTLGPTNIGGVTFEGSSQFQTIGPPNNSLLTNSQQIRNTTGSTATVLFAVGGTDFASPTATFSAAGSGTWLNAPGSTIAMGWYGDTANQQGASDVNDHPGVLLTSGGPFTAGAGASSFDTGTLTGPFATTGPFSWTMTANASLISGGTATLAGRSQDITNDVIPVPEPSGLLILGGSLISLAAFLRRRSRKNNRSNFAAA